MIGLCPKKNILQYSTNFTLVVTDKSVYSLNDFLNIKFYNESINTNKINKKVKYTTTWNKLTELYEIEKYNIIENLDNIFKFEENFT